VCDDAGEGVEALVLSPELAFAGLPLGDIPDCPEVVGRPLDPLASGDRRDRNRPTAVAVVGLGRPGLPVREGVPVPVEPVGLEVDGNLPHLCPYQLLAVDTKQGRVRTVDVPVRAVGAVDRDTDANGLDHRLEDRRVKVVHTTWCANSGY